MCNAWNFNDYCPIINASNVNSIEQKNLHKMDPKSNNNFYNNDHVYLYAFIQTNLTQHVNIKFLIRPNIKIYSSNYNLYNL